MSLWTKACTEKRSSPFLEDKVAAIPSYDASTTSRRRVPSLTAISSTPSTRAAVTLLASTEGIMPASIEAEECASPEPLFVGAAIINLPAGNSRYKEDQGNCERRRRHS